MRRDKIFVCPSNPHYIYSGLDGQTRIAHQFAAMQPQFDNPRLLRNKARLFFNKAGLLAFKR